MNTSVCPSVDPNAGPRSREEMVVEDLRRKQEEVLSVY
jgi:hypothetical protein